MARGRYQGQMNQAERGAPAFGPFGRALYAAVAGKGPDAVINRPAPVATPTYKFRNFLGAFMARPAVNKMVWAPGGYGGILPMDQQPSLFKPKPWNDPTRGAP